jgi:hypothetical protein
MAALRFVGKDPDSPNNGSPTVWLDEENGDFVIQGWRLDPDTLAQVGDVPSHEVAVRLPARMAPFLREVASGGAAHIA